MILGHFCGDDLCGIEIYQGEVSNERFNVLDFFG